MTLWPDSASRKFLLTIAVTLGISPTVAQAEAMAHPGTEAALQCLLKTGPKGCEQVFVAAASLSTRFWTLPNPQRDFALGPLSGTRYAGADPGAHALGVHYMSPEVPVFDIYDVKFAHQEMTFYIAPPDTDGKIRYMRSRSGAPDQRG